MARTKMKRRHVENTATDQDGVDEMKAKQSKAKEGGF